jgi:hypothetical protein
VTIEGDFETHLTVASPGTTGLEVLRAFAVESKLKITHIVLPRGNEPSQWMLTRHSTGTLEETLAAAHALSSELADRNLSVRRIKVEIDAAHSAAPSSRLEAERRPADRHFEHHLKVLVRPPSLGLDILGDIARRNGAHLSRNAFRVRDDGMEERFLTQRFYACGRGEASAALDALIAGLQQTGFTILDREAEYVVHDDNAAIDAGWMIATT